MIFNTSGKGLTAVLFSTVLLSACGGSDGNSSSSNSSNKPSEPLAPDKPAETVKPSKPIEPDSKPPVAVDAELDANSIASKNYSQAALAGSNKISLERQSCGLGGLSNDEALSTLATQHTQYIQHVFSNATPSTFNAHQENEIADIKAWTGNNNPFFSGISFQDRLLKAKYPNLAYGVVENISQTIYFSSTGMVVSPEYAAQAMVKSLVAAPYHMRLLMMPGISQTGSGLVAYKPYNKATDKNQGYVFVNASAVTASSKNNTVKGLFTYPCANVTDANTALYNESPSPVAGTGRDLRADPIGQPIYINMPAAKTISVSNIKFHDIQRNIDVPTNLLDYNQDPHKGTMYELPKNEAFILPITDTLKSCEMGSKKGKNCGLYGNSEYKVSFDVLVDNKTLETKQFTFKTGDVNY